MATQGRLILGTKDGDVVIVEATKALRKELLEPSGGLSSVDAPPVRVLSGHKGPVTCVCYPHEEHPRYDPGHMISGGVDFSVCLWDLNSGSRIHKFCVQAGPILKFLVPPSNCNVRTVRCAYHNFALLYFGLSSVYVG